MQKTAKFWYCAHTSGSTNKKYRTFNMGNNITCTANCNYRIDVILYTILTWFVPGIQLWILYIKVITDDDWWWWWLCTSRMRSYNLREKVLLHQLGSWSVLFNDPCDRVSNRWMNEYGAVVEWQWPGKQKDFKRTLFKCHFVHHTTHKDWSGFEFLAV